MVQLLRPVAIDHYLALDQLHNCATMNININNQAAFCRALGDTTRLRIMRLLSASGDEACLCELEMSLQEPGYKLSRHLKILRDAGLLEAEKEGRWVYHRVTTKPAFLIHLRHFVEALPDAAGLYQQDMARFEESKRCRVGGRCRADRQQTADEEAVPRRGAVGGRRG